MNRYIFFLLAFNPLFADYYNLREFKNDAVIKTTNLEIPGITLGFNPSMISHTEDTILMVFRHQPALDKPWISEICYLILDKEFNPLHEVETLNLRKSNPEIPSRTEDPRLISFNGRIYLLYNDNLEVTEEHPGPRRDMYLVELIASKKKGVKATKPVLLKHPTHYPDRVMEKNWVPFIYENQLLLAYSLNPHEILVPDLETGKCEIFSTTEKQTFEFLFPWGELRGGTPAIQIGDTYLAFFHSFRTIHSNVSRHKRIPHYIFGVYQFSPEPPFEIVAMSPHPIIGKDLYYQSAFHKRVVYPSGILFDNDYIHVCCGQDDESLLVLTLDKEKLIKDLQPVNN